MKFKSIDPSLEAWARVHALHISTKYKDSEVRSTDVVGSSGRKYQIWVEPSGTENSFLVKVWDYKKRKAQFPASQANISEKLEEAWKTAQLWMTQ